MIRSIDSIFGGPPVISSKLASAQSKLGCETCIFHYSFGRPSLTIKIHSENSNAQATSINLGEETPLEWLWPRKAQRHFERSFSSGNIVHLHGVWEPMLRTAWNVARRHGCACVLTPHGMLGPWSLKEKMEKKTRTGAVFQVNARGCRRADCVEPG